MNQSGVKQGEVVDLRWCSKDNLEQWHFLVKNRHFTEDDIERFSDFLCWDHVARVSVISSEFTTKHLDKLMTRFLLDKTTITKATFLSFTPPEEYIGIWNETVPEMSGYSWGLLTACLSDHKHVLMWLSRQLLGN